MSASIKGRTVVFGVTAGAITAAHAATTAGIVESFSISAGGETVDIGDEDNDLVTRIDHGAKNTVSLEVLCEPTSDLPAKGDEITGMGTIDGVAFGTGRVFVETAQVQYQKAQVKKITVTASHYPSMAADPS